ncbi:PEP-CTERM sorting domain-containing protein [Opitutales bacterium]|nr:PEP-CTERM sorting domain-containing protein [Opitutales bacterium]MDB2358255.1 PEP-CTERM sorting domain-containing protein [Opitutales bacterium]
MRCLVYFLTIVVSIYTSKAAIIPLDAATDGNFVEAVVGVPVPEWGGDSTSNKGYLDLVGNNQFGTFYTGFDDVDSSSSTDGTMYFRARVAEGNKKSTDPYRGQIYVGFDLTDNGTIDYLLSYNGSTSNSSISLYKPSGFNSPDTTTNPVNLGNVATFTTNSIVNQATTAIDATNSNFSSVIAIDGLTSTTANIDGGVDNKGAPLIDHFLTWSFSFSDFSATIRENSLGIANAAALDLGGFDDTYTFSMLVMTSDANSNAFGGADYGGINDNALGSSFSVGAGLSAPTSLSGTVPEPSRYPLLLGLAALGWVASCRRRYITKKAIR